MKNKRFFLSALLTFCLSVLWFFPASAASAAGDGRAAVASFSPLTYNRVKAKTCRVTNPAGANVYIEKTGKNVRLSKGTLLSIVDGKMHQGLIVVRFRQGKRSVIGDIDVGDTNCIDGA